VTAEAKAGPSQLNLSNITLRANWRNVLRNFMNAKPNSKIKSVKDKYPKFFNNINKSAMEHLYRIHATPKFGANRLINAITEVQALKRNEPAVYNKKVASAWKALLNHINKYNAIH
jgi:hypothetical protein